MHFILSIQVIVVYISVGDFHGLCTIRRVTTSESQLKLTLYRCTEITQYL